jgi:hypothetical protein
MEDHVIIETDLFEHREVMPHFINPCCFGEDFAAWLLAEIAALKDDGFGFSVPIQEDYGWGFWSSRGKDRFWVALSYVGDGPTEGPAQFGVSIKASKWRFRRPDARAFATLRDRIWQSLRANEAIKVEPRG